MTAASLTDQLVDFFLAEYGYIFGASSRGSIVALVQGVLSSDMTAAQKEQYLSEPWRIIYRSKPPTPEEFTTEEWLGKGAKVYDHVRKAFVHVFTPQNRVFRTFESMHIGWGKSVFLALSGLYVGTHISMMHDPKEFFDVDRSTAFGIYFGSFTNQKAEQTLLKYFNNYLRNNPKFIRVKFKDKMAKVQAENPNCVVYSGKSEVGIVSFFNDVHVVIASDYTDLLGLNLILCGVTEISFFLKKGADPEYINDFIEGLEGRVVSRFGFNNPLAKIFYDSSPYSYQSPIDQQVFSGEAAQDKKNYVITGSHWETFPGRYPEFDTNWFLFYCGSENSRPRVVSDDEARDLNDNDVVRVPGSLVNMAKRSPLRFLRDYVGRPSHSTPSFITKDLVEQCTRLWMPNVPFYLSSLEVQGKRSSLLTQFKQSINWPNTTMFSYDYRSEIFYCHLDMSDRVCTTGITIGHKELLVRDDGTPPVTMYVLDATIPVVTFGDEVPYDEVLEMLLWIREQVPGFQYVSTDRAAGLYMCQQLEGAGFTVNQKLSVDKTPDGYMAYKHLARNGQVVHGANPVLFGNYLSLLYTTPSNRRIKIDHMQGDETSDSAHIAEHRKWESFKDVWAYKHLGQNAKDLTDSSAGCVCNMMAEPCPIGRVWRELGNLSEEKGTEEREALLQSLGLRFL